MIISQFYYSYRDTPHCGEASSCSTCHHTYKLTQLSDAYKCCDELKKVLCFLAVSFQTKQSDALRDQCFICNCSVVDWRQCDDVCRMTRFKFHSEVAHALLQKTFCTVYKTPGLSSNGCSNLCDAERILPMFFLLCHFFAAAPVEGGGSGSSLLQGRGETYTHTQICLLFGSF